MWYSMLQNGCFLDFSTAVLFFFVLFFFFFFFYNFAVFDLATLFLICLRNWPLIFTFSESMTPKLKSWSEESKRNSADHCFQSDWNQATPQNGEALERWKQQKQTKSWVEIFNGDSAFNPVVCRSHELPLMHTEARRERFWVFNYAFIKTGYSITLSLKFLDVNLVKLWTGKSMKQCF